MLATTSTLHLLLFLILQFVDGDHFSRTRYLLYDVNPGEGFNLRRDVYMRVAQLAHDLQQHTQDRWVLVLPPWRNLYHWRIVMSGDDSDLPWSAFFNLQSLSSYTPVLEFNHFIHHINTVDTIFYLQSYVDAFKDGKFEEKVQIDKCRGSPNSLSEYINLVGGGGIFGYTNISTTHFHCVSAQGSAIKVMTPFLSTSLPPTAHSVMLERAEVLLHDKYGLSEFWKVRKSMKFSQDLIDEGDRFRESRLNSTDRSDVNGGDYLAVHLRRRDYVYSHPQDIPSIEGAARQIKKLISTLSLTRIFLATDAVNEEVKELEESLGDEIDLLRYEENVLHPGQIAVVEQWIASHAKYFIGTHSSTFSFRIQEERELLQLPPETTFNCLCPDSSKSKEWRCEQPTRWEFIENDEDYWKKLTSRRNEEL